MLDVLEKVQNNSSRTIDQEDAKRIGQSVITVCDLSYMSLYLIARYADLPKGKPTAVFFLDLRSGKVEMTEQDLSLVAEAMGIAVEDLLLPTDELLAKFSNAGRLCQKPAEPPSPEDRRLLDLMPGYRDAYYKHKREEVRLSGPDHPLFRKGDEKFGTMLVELLEEYPIELPPQCEFVQLNRAAIASGKLGLPAEQVREILWCLTDVYSKEVKDQLRFQELKKAVRNAGLLLNKQYRSKRQRPRKRRAG